MKLENRTGHIQIPLSQLRITSNVRTDFDESEIAELAQSIKENGLINAITVKPPVTDEHGDKTYEVIAGGRRIRAHQWLCEHGDDFSMVDCKIVTGDMWTLQMIENIQRTDLTPRDKENAIAAALEQGLTQKQIADRLSKPIQYVNDIVAGAKVRKIADAAYLNTDGVSTKALAQLRGIPESELTEYLEELCMRGGSVATATALLHEWKAKQAEKELAKETPRDDFPPPTTPVISDESEPDIDEQINGMFMDEAEDIEYNEDDTDESTIAPTELTEVDFYYRAERDKIEGRFISGEEIDKVGRRLFFKDLWNQRYIAIKIDKKNIVCIVASDVSGNAKEVTISYWKNNNKRIDITHPRELVDYAAAENAHWFLYEIPDDAKSVAAPNVSESKAPIGAIISHPGKRLFRKDLKAGMQFVSGDCKVRQILGINRKLNFLSYTSDPIKAHHHMATMGTENIDSENEESWIYSIPDDATVRPGFFNWFINNTGAMEAAMLELPTQIKKMPAGTKICVQAGSKIAEISSVIYEPNENRLIFRCLEDFGVY